MSACRVAERGKRSNRLISPKNSPGPKRASTWSTRAGDGLGDDHRPAAHQVHRVAMVALPEEDLTLAEACARARSRPAPPDPGRDSSKQPHLPQKGDGLSGDWPSDGSALGGDAAEQVDLQLVDLLRCGGLGQVRQGLGDQHPFLRAQLVAWPEPSPGFAGARSRNSASIMARPTRSANRGSM